MQFEINGDEGVTLLQLPASAPPDEAPSKDLHYRQSLTIHLSMVHSAQL
jgi:hypothetical protein